MYITSIHQRYAFFHQIVTGQNFIPQSCTYKRSHHSSIFIAPHTLPSKKKSPAEPFIFIYFLLVNIYNGGGDLNPEHLRWKHQEVLVELLGSWQLSSGT